MFSKTPSTSPTPRLQQQQRHHSLFNFNDICKEGNTFLWDFVQNEKLYQTNEKLMREAEKQLFMLVCYQTDRQIKIKFIEGCISNLKNNR